MKSLDGPWYIKTMRNISIRPGDTVILAPENGLGRGRFFVLDVDDRDVIHQLYVQGSNGVTWWARAQGARIVNPR